MDADAPSCTACGAQFTLTCDVCGGVVAADDARCPHCGEVFTEETEAWEEVLECDACGGLVDEADAVCPHCGARFD
ncbi:MAG: hypothetical protein HZY76_16910 [Anaerolineae bacterium]|nr:MAG: hypothetical protein HZY76_16910 [Anaerolineae bacterium]